MAVRSDSLAAEAGPSGLTAPLSPPEGSATLEHRRASRTPDIGLVDLAAFGVILLAGVRQTLLLHERGRLLDDSSTSSDSPFTV